MDQGLNIFRYAVIVLVGLNAVLLLRPKYIVYIYVGLILFIPNTLALGVKKGFNYLDFYGAGTGVMLRPLISLYLLLLFFIALFAFRNDKLPLRRCHPLFFMMFLSVYYLVYAFYGTISNIPLSDILQGNSAIFVVDLTLLFYILLKFGSEEREFSRFTRFIIICVFTREVYGLIRFLFFGGDFSNVYSNVEKIHVRLTFQDINDSLLACLTGFYCAWELMYNRIRMRLVGRVFYVFVVGMSVFTIMFSYRRSAWIGLCLAAGYFVLKQPLRRQILAGIVVTAVATIMFGFMMTSRLGQYEKSRSSLLLYDITDRSGQITMKSGRFTEVARGLETISHNVMSGVGPWGSIEALSGIEGWSVTDSLSNRDYMHGGLLQVWLKLGFPGFALFFLALVTFIVFCLKRSRELMPEKRGWLEAGFAGMLFMIPTLCIGTPVIEYRTMQLMALCLALPYITVALLRRTPNDMSNGIILSFTRNSVTNSGS